VILLFLVVLGFLVGLGTGRWWSLLAAVAVGVWVSLVEEVEVAGWWLGTWYGAAAALGIAAGVLLRRRFVRTD
jgi:hypothetical protein